MIRSILCPKNVQPDLHPFTQLYHRSGEHIRKVLRAAYPDAHIRIADEDYSTISIDEFNRWLKTDDVSDMSWEKNYRDCDDIARAIRCRIFAIGQEYKTSITVAYCEGYTSTGEYHAFNIVVTNDDNVYILEPQTDCLSLANDSSYTPDFIQL